MRKLKLFLSTLLLALFISGSMIGQGYVFTDVVRNQATPVKNQASTGTCWAYAAAGFLEAELLRTGKGEHDLAEMFVVRHNYVNRMNDNFIRRGAGNLGQGSLAHMFINIVKEHGIVPEEVYSGINYDSPAHNHRELNKFVNTLSTTAVALKDRSPEYYKLKEALLDTYLGKIPEKFTYKGKEYTPKSFAQSTGLNMNDYVSLTSFSHFPFYEKVVIEVQDNWNYEGFYNLPIDEFIEVIDNALLKGYTVCWDGDVSERGFSHATGIAINPEISKLDDYSGTDRARFEKLSVEDKYAQIFKFENIFPEINVTQDVRQKGYEAFNTTDDHLMLLTGIVKDQQGNNYYITKNSWGTARNKFAGYLHMSKSYVRAKSISVLLHKESIPMEIRKKLGI